jgi:hypothetical protein
LLLQLLGESDLVVERLLALAGRIADAIIEGEAAGAGDAVQHIALLRQLGLFILVEDVGAARLAADQLAIVVIFVGAALEIERTAQFLVVEPVVAALEGEVGRVGRRPVERDIGRDILALILIFGE